MVGDISNILVLFYTPSVNINRCPAPDAPLKGGFDVKVSYMDSSLTLVCIRGYSCALFVAQHLQVSAIVLYLG